MITITPAASAAPEEKHVPGEWYLGPECKACLTRIPIAHDHPRVKIASGLVRFRIRDNGRIPIRCPKCGATDAYSRDEIESFQSDERLTVTDWPQR